MFRNPLADPYLLGAAAGAGLGATIAIVGALDASSVRSTRCRSPPSSARWSPSPRLRARRVRAAGDRRPRRCCSPGVAVASFLTAVQTYVQQRNHDTIREVYSWILGRLSTAGWREVRLLLPYAVGRPAVVLLAHRRVLDVLAVGDEEATTLGLHVRRTRLSWSWSSRRSARPPRCRVSGLIGFVGIIVPHTVRLLAGSSYRVVLPLSILFGGAFLVPRRPPRPDALVAGRDPDRRGHRVLRRAVLRARAPPPSGRGRRHDQLEGVSVRLGVELGRSTGSTSTWRRASG